MGKRLWWWIYKSSLAVVHTVTHSGQYYAVESVLMGYLWDGIYIYDQVNVIHRFPVLAKGD